MKISKLINYSTNICGSRQGSITLGLINVLGGYLTFMNIPLTNEEGPYTYYLRVGRKLCLEKKANCQGEGHTQHKGPRMK
jgi:hypothetical protein